VQLSFNDKKISPRWAIASVIASCIVIASLAEPVKNTPEASSIFYPTQLPDIKQ